VDRGAIFVILQILCSKTPSSGPDIYSHLD
jgi:hypothetical protein